MVPELLKFQKAHPVIIKVTSEEKQNLNLKLYNVYRTVEFHTIHCHYKTGIYFNIAFITAFLIYQIFFIFGWAFKMTFTYIQKWMTVIVIVIFIVWKLLLFLFNKNINFKKVWRLYHVFPSEHEHFWGRAGEPVGGVSYQNERYMISAQNYLIKQLDFNNRLFDSFAFCSRIGWFCQTLSWWSVWGGLFGNSFRAYWV